MGLWIDLTNTTRFYSKREIEVYGCKYVKIPCVGHGETPSKEQIDEFLHLVEKFIAHHPLQKIAVHCTHGYNRTGYLITNYLVVKLNKNLTEALNLFSRCRPPGICKQEYIDDLFKRFTPTFEVSSATAAPELPTWSIGKKNVCNVH